MEKKSYEEVLSTFYKVHGHDRYDYSMFKEYNGSKSTIYIKCNRCGETFPQLVGNHLRGAGCPNCANKATSARQTEPLSSVILKLKDKYGDAYDFSLINESNYKTKKSVVQVVCKKHGAFPTRLADMQNGHGCPHCARERFAGCSNPKNKKLVCGVGINDYDKSVYTSGEVVREAYKHWYGMILRCYCKNHEQKFPAYKDCSVCKEWFAFSNFLRWFKENWNPCMSDYHLDKDILVKRNRIYSPETCCLVPPYVNTMLIKCGARRGSLPIGVYYDKERNRYGSAMMKNHKPVQKRFDSIEEAFKFYKKEKESHIKETAQRYYDEGNITEKVYKALLNYKVEITD